MSASRTMTAKQLFRLVGAANMGDADAARQVREWAAANPSEARFEAQRNYRLAPFVRELAEADHG